MDILDIRAIAHHFGDDSSSSIRRAFLLLTIIKQYLAELKSNRNNVISHDGYIVRTSVELKYLTGISDKVIYGDLDFLCDEGLIEKRKGLGMKLRIDPDYLLSQISDWKIEYQEWLEKKFGEVYANRKDFYEDIIERNESRNRPKEEALAKVDISDPKALLADFTETETWLIYLFSHYYRAYTGHDYIWSLVKLNTLMSVWKSGMNKDWPERALSKAIKEAISDRSKTYFEVKWRTCFNPDVKSDDVIFDSLYEVE